MDLRAYRIILLLLLPGISIAQIANEQLLLPRVLNEQPLIVDITDVKAESISQGTVNFDYLINGWVLDPNNYINVPYECDVNLDPDCCKGYEFCNEKIKVRMCIDDIYIHTNQPNKTTNLNDDFCPTCRNGFQFVVNSSQISPDPNNQAKISIYWKKPNSLGVTPTGNDICAPENDNNKIYEESHSFTADVQDLSDPNSDRILIGSHGSECEIERDENGIPVQDPTFDCNDILLETENGNDYIYGLGGDDRPIRARPGDDSIYGNNGKDVIYAGSGNDKANGGLDDDRIRPGAGVDWLYGSYDGDEYIINQGYGVNHIIDPLSGENDNWVNCKGSTLNAGTCYFSHTSNTTFVLFPGDGALIFYDNLLAESIVNNQNTSITLTDIDACLAVNICDSHENPTNAEDYILDSAGSCPGSSSCSITIPSTLPTPIGVCNASNIHLGFQDDQIKLDSTGHYVDTSSGNDQVCSGDGDDVVIGGSGDDHLVGQAGNDKIIGGPGDDILEGGTGDDIYIYEVFDGVDTIIDNGGANKIYCLGAYGSYDSGTGILNFSDQASDPYYVGSITIQTSNNASFTFYGCEKE